VFSDGTIRTLSSDETGGSNNKLQQAGSGVERSLGWISDRRGIPCVTGTRISNAMNYLSGRILASAAEAAAGAFSQNEVTNTVSALGGVATSVITGDSAKYAAGKALSGGASEISEYLRERQAQSFDAIYVDTGAELAIHIDIELPIDYEQEGRKTSYDYAENTEYSVLD
jgi:integrating conjugative element protein (TIGR03752 family)